MHQRFMEGLRYQLGKRTKNISDIVNKIMAAMGQLVQLSDGLRSVMEWFRGVWYRTRLSPLYAEIFDIPVNMENTSMPAYTTPDFQSTSYAPMQPNATYAPDATAYIAPKTPQTMLHYQQYENFQPSQDQFTMYNVQNSTYTSVTDYTDEPHHQLNQPQQNQQFLYATGQERWHNSAFEPYTTDVASTSQRVEPETVGDVSRDENTSTSTYAESHVCSRSHSSATSPGFAVTDVGQNTNHNNGNNRPPPPPPTLINSAREVADFIEPASVENNTIVSGDDPFAAYQNVDIPIRSRDNGIQSVVETEQNHSTWIQLSDLNGLEKSVTEVKSEMPTLIPATEILEGMGLEKSTSRTLESTNSHNAESGEALPVENRNGS